MITGTICSSGGCNVLTVDHDPTVVATDVPQGSIIIDSSGVRWLKLDNGSTTNVVRTRGSIGKVLIRDYTGDDTNDRVIDLGDDYDRIEIRPRSSWTTAHWHMAFAIAIRTAYDLTYRTNIEMKHECMAAANNHWQGKMTGGDANKIKLGAIGNDSPGTNKIAHDYRILAMKFSEVQS